MTYPCGHESIGHNDGPCCAVCELGEQLARQSAVIQAAREWLLATPGAEYSYAETRLADAVRALDAEKE